MPTIFVAANDWKSRWSRATTRLPLVTMAAMPLTTKVMASVPMSGLIRNWVTMTPLAMPTARPTARPARTPATGETEDAVVSATAPASP